MAANPRTLTGRGSLADVRGLTGSRRLASRAAAGDERAFAAIFERHHQELYRYCLAIVRNPADAEDAMQSAMAKTLRALPGEEREITLRPWLFRVAHNEAISVLRARREVDSTPVAETVAGGVEPAVEVERSERLRTLVRDLNALPERQRGALVMRELSGLGYDEIGAALDCGEGAARQSVYEARSALLIREEGRAMDCADVRRAISDGDRRRLRGRALKAHLADCRGCSDFRAAIDLRRNDLAALAPPIAAAPAAAILGGLLGGTGGGGAAAGVGAGAGAGATAGVGLAGGAAGGAALKGASVVAALAIAAGGAGQATGVIDLPNPLRGSTNEATTPATQNEATPSAAGLESGSGSAGAGAAGEPAKAGPGAAKGGGGHANERGNGSGRADGGSGAGNSEAAQTKPNGSDGVTGPPGHSNAGGNGNGSGTPGAGSSGSNAGGNAGGSSSTAPGQTGIPPATSNAGGNSGTNANGGGAGAAPGQTGIPPATSNAGGNGKNSADTP